MTDRLTSAIGSLLTRVAADVVMPRFQTLRADQIVEKSPGDLVTIADRESEVLIADGLSKLLPEARIVGEEAVSADPQLLTGLNEGLVWLIDPIDGTSNFAEGKSPFALMVALLDNGESIGGWIYDPVVQRMCHALRGQGSYINGDRVVAQESGAVLPLAALATTFMTPEKRDDINARAAGKLTIMPIPRCAGEQYPQIVLGTHDVALFERTLPWDHAAGALFLEEAGGVTARTDGSRYRVGDGRRGMLGAASQRLWDDTAHILFA